MTEEAKQEESKAEATPAKETPQYPPSAIEEPPLRQFQAIMAAALKEMNLSFPSQAVDHMACLYEMLVEANSRLNLVGEGTPEAIAIRHIADSLLLLTTDAIGDLEIRRAIDIGSGAGFPGLVLAIVQPEIEWALIEATGKKARFIEDVRFSLGLDNVMVSNSRSEALAQNVVHREEYQLAVARAVGGAPVLCELGLPFLKKGGRLIAYKGPEGPAELAQAEVAAAECGGTALPHLSAKLPKLGHARTFLMWEKTSPTPPKYPRREGMPEKNPLGS